MDLSEIVFLYVPYPIQVKPDGTIEIKEWTVGFLLGGQEGNGTLKFRGKSYPLKSKRDPRGSDGWDRSGELDRTRLWIA